MSSLGSDLMLGYMDDLTLAGPQGVVSTDIQKMTVEGSKMGLCLNPSKCELISHPYLQMADQTLLTFTVVSVALRPFLGLHFSLAEFWMTHGQLVVRM